MNLADRRFVSSVLVAFANDDSKLKVRDERSDWLAVLRNDKRAIVTAAAKAQSDADSLHGIPTARAAVAMISGDGFRGA
ncbi:MAG: hypothetical protein E5W94_27935 [Mesorhizobium sp.]|nr:MAG: hypothetical protein E5W94_27935 [Mesorhizobium sp.]